MNINISVDIPGKRLWAKRSVWGKCSVRRTYIDYRMLTKVLVVAAFVLIVVWLISCVWKKRKRKLPPGPSGYLCFGNTFQIDVDRICHDLYKIHVDYGHIVRVTVHGTVFISLSSVFAIKEAFEADLNSEHANDRSKNSTADIYYGRKHIGLANLSNITLNLRDFHKFKIFTIFKHGGSQRNHFRDELKRLHLNLISSPGGDISPHEQLRIFHRNLCSIVVSILMPC